MSKGALELRRFRVWLGGLMNPEAYVTATRQCIAQANSWSLEELELDVTIADLNQTPDDGSFIVTGKLSIHVLLKNIYNFTELVH